MKCSGRIILRFYYPRGGLKIEILQIASSGLMIDYFFHFLHYAMLTIHNSFVVCLKLFKTDSSISFLLFVSKNPLFVFKLAIF